MIPQVDLRKPEEVMKLSRLGSLHQSRISFMRVLLRRLASENWRFDKPNWNIDDDGFGYATYSVHGPERSYTLVAFAHDLPAELRSDRVIAEAWDCTFTLHDGIPSEDDIIRLKNNVPLQEAGRISKNELTLSRANRSVRLWNYVVDSLAAGIQPDEKKLNDVGYLMRTTAVYGSGKFGASDRSKISDRQEMRTPFQAEMLTVYLIRCFVMDLVDFVASKKGGDAAVKLDPKLRKSMGIGNSTGLGMAPFLVNHPALLSTWIYARETALARVRAIKTVPEETFSAMREHLNNALKNAQSWTSEHEIQKPKIKIFCDELSQTVSKFETLDKENYPWDALHLWSTNKLSEDTQEQIISALFEPYSELVDDLSDCMYIDEAKHFKIDASISTDGLKKQIKENYEWAINIDYSKKENLSRFWYVSESKLEPRLGERFEEDGSELEQPLAVARDIAALNSDLNKKQNLGEFLLAHPEHRHIVRRIQLSKKFPYSEIRDNLLNSKMLPIDMLRCKLSFFGATKFDPRSDRWVRICMFKDAPFPKELTSKDNWSYGAQAC
ncbi:hypothetical protein N9Q20_01580 [Amylibacter sp.]|nr:hypothetical protein [Amylibacter sp.]